MGTLAEGRAKFTHPGPWGVAYRVDGAEHEAGPYASRLEARAECEDIAGYDGVTDARVVELPLGTIGEPKPLWTAQQRADPLKNLAAKVWSVFGVGHLSDPRPDPSLPLPITTLCGAPLSDGRVRRTNIPSQADCEECLRVWNARVEAYGGS